MSVIGNRTADDPWTLLTPPGTSEYQMHRDDNADPAELVCQVGSTKVRYLARGAVRHVRAAVARTPRAIELEHNQRNNILRAR
jgi:hypothetical protein